jgi:hypothetical protein
MTDNICIIEFYHEHVLLTQASDWMSSSELLGQCSVTKMGRNFSSHHHVQADFEANPPFCETDTGPFSPGIN